VTAENRKHPRIPLNANVKIMHDSFGTIEAKAKDISDGGMFIIHKGVTFPPAGTEMQVQALGMPIEAPILKVKIVHVGPNGIGLAFC